MYWGGVASSKAWAEMSLVRGGASFYGKAKHLNDCQTFK